MVLVWCWMEILVIYIIWCVWVLRLVVGVRMSCRYGLLIIGFSRVCRGRGCFIVCMFILVSCFYGGFIWRIGRMRVGRFIVWVLGMFIRDV